MALALIMQNEAHCNYAKGENKMKMLVLMTGLLSAYAANACDDFSGTYRLEDNSSSVTITQVNCESVDLKYETILNDIQYNAKSEYSKLFSFDHDDRFIKFGFMQTYFFDDLTTITKDLQEGLNVKYNLRTFFKDKNGDLIEKAVRMNSSEKEVLTKSRVWKRMK